MDVVFQDEPVSNPGHQTSELFAHAIDSLTVEVPRGEAARTKVYCAIVSQLPAGQGALGWILGGRSSGDILITDVTTVGTAADDEPEGLLRGGFRVSEGGLGGGPSLFSRCGDSGFNIGAVLTFRPEPVTLEPEGTATILSINLAAKSFPGDAPMTGRIDWLNSVCSCYYDPEGGGATACGQPVSNHVIVSGLTVLPCEHPVTVTFLEKLLSPFLRGDANTDGRVDISDAVRIIIPLPRGDGALLRQHGRHERLGRRRPHGCPRDPERLLPARDRHSRAGAL